MCLLVYDCEPLILARIALRVGYTREGQRTLIHNRHNNANIYAYKRARELSSTPEIKTGELYLGCH